MKIEKLDYATKFVKIVADDGCYLTYYKDGDDIIQFDIIDNIIVYIDKEKEIQAKLTELTEEKYQQLLTAHNEAIALLKENNSDNIIDIKSLMK